MGELATKFGEDVALIEAGIEVTDRAGSDRVREVLTGIPNVVEVTAPKRTGEPWLVGVRPASEETRVRRAILAAASSTGLDLTSVRPLAPSLEEIYRRAVERIAPHTHGEVQ
jgi:hypothetical protein